MEVFLILTWQNKKLAIFVHLQIFKWIVFFRGKRSFLNFSVKSQSLKDPDGILGCQSIRCSLRLREAQGSKERPELEACSWGEEDSIRGILAAPAGLMELGNNQTGGRKGTVTRWRNWFYLDSGFHLVSHITPHRYISTFPRVQFPQPDSEIH